MLFHRKIYVSLEPSVLAQNTPKFRFETFAKFAIRFCFAAFGPRYIEAFSSQLVLNVNNFVLKPVICKNCRCFFTFGEKKLKKKRFFRLEIVPPWKISW